MNSTTARIIRKALVASDRSSRDAHLGHDERIAQNCAALRSTLEALDRSHGREIRPDLIDSLDRTIGQLRSLAASTAHDRDGLLHVVITSAERARRELTRSNYTPMRAFTSEGARNLAWAPRRRRLGRGLWLAAAAIAVASFAIAWRARA